MAYRMTNISDRIRVGIMASGCADIEVYDRHWRDPDAQMESILIPMQEVEELGLYLVKASR